MKVIEYIGKVLPDGRLSLPDEIRKELDLNQQNKVRIVITVNDFNSPDERKEWEVFRDLGKNAIDSNLSDTSINHDLSRQEIIAELERLGNQLRSGEPLKEIWAEIEKERKEDR